MNVRDGELTEKEEEYCQLRAQGFSKAQAARKVYKTEAVNADGRDNARQVGYITEKRQDVQDRIEELRMERAEQSKLTVEEQVRRYNDIYWAAMRDGKNMSLALKVLERLDAIGGFEAAKRSISLKGNVGEHLKGEEGLDKELERFAGILGTPKPSQDESKVARLVEAVKEV